MNDIDQLPDDRLAVIGVQEPPLIGNGNPRQAFFLVSDSLGNNISLSIPLLSNKCNFEICPNPAGNVLCIKRMENETIKTFSIINSIGQKLP